MTDGRERIAWHPSPFISTSAAIHLAAAGTLAVHTSSWPYVAGVLIIDHLLLGFSGTWPRSRLLGPNLTRLPAAAVRRREVAITFDDGPNPRVTAEILDLLDEYGARASFFPIGERAAAHPDLVREIAARGHGLENHSWRHAKLFAFFGIRALGRELDRAQEMLQALGGRRPRFFRAPAGIRSSWLEPVLCSRGLSLVSWTRRGFDTVSREPSRIVSRLGRRLAAGDIVVLHDGSCALDHAGRPVVLETLPRLLDRVAELGLSPVALHQAAGC